MLERAIIEFLGALRQGDLTGRESEAHVALLTTVVNFRTISDIFREDLADVARAAAASPAVVLDRALFGDLYEGVRGLVEAAMTAIEIERVDLGALRAATIDVRERADGNVSIRRWLRRPRATSGG